MAIGERFRSGGAHGIARFLAEHQDCNGGFDVRRDDQLGSGKLRITCAGCGATVDYRAAEAGEIAAGGLPTNAAPDNGVPQGPPAAPMPPPAMPPAAMPPPAVPPAARPTMPIGPGAPPVPIARQSAGAAIPTSLRRDRPVPAVRPSRGLVPSWLSVALIAALILGGLTMIAIGLTRDDKEQPPAAAPSAGGKPAQQTPAQTGTPTQPAPAEQPSAAAVPLDKRTFENRFVIGVPRGWQDGLEDGGVSLTGPGSTAEIVVFFQQGGPSEPELAKAARGFLAQRHPGAQVAAPQPIRLGSERGLQVQAAYQGGEEIAVVISAGGYSHVVLRRVDRGASPDLEQQADAALASFRPR